MYIDDKLLLFFSKYYIENLQNYLYQQHKTIKFTLIIIEKIRAMTN